MHATEVADPLDIPGRPTAMFAPGHGRYRSPAVSHPCTVGEH